MVPPRQTDVASASALRNCRLRCIACGQSADGFAVNFRCPACGDLLEVVYTEFESKAASPGPAVQRDLKSVWLERKKSSLAADQSGVWRFRDLLPVFSEPSAVVTLREGNTPLYSLLRCRTARGSNAFSRSTRA